MPSKDQSEKLLRLLKSKNKKYSKKKPPLEDEEQTWPFPRVKPAKVDLPLRRYQKLGVSLIDHFDGRALLADEMGLGKTVQAIAWAMHRNVKKPIVVVCPAILKENWRREFLKWSPYRSILVLESHPAILNDRKFYKYLRSLQVIIVNYEILANVKSKKKTGWADYLANTHPELVIVDECHSMMNRKAGRSKEVRRISRGVPYIIAISGTPYLNKPVELANIINFLKPGLIRTKEYKIRYCGGEFNGFGWTYDGATHQRELHRFLKAHLMIRRLKKKVYKELPEKSRVVLPLTIEMDEYVYARDNFKEWLKAQGVENIPETIAMNRIEKLKQLAVKGKLKACVDWIKEFLESGEKLIVYATHIDVVKQLIKQFPDAVSIYGATRKKDRQVAVDRFQEDPECKLLIGNIQAAGVGLTLTAASNTCFLELGWNPAQHDQAEDRVHRIGQTKSVTAWYLLASGTIEEDIAQLIDEKRKNEKAIMDGENVEPFLLLTELIKRMIA